MVGALHKNETIKKEEFRRVKVALFLGWKKVFL